MSKNLDSLMPNLAVTSPGHAQCHVKRTFGLITFSIKVILIK